VWVFPIDGQRFIYLKVLAGFDAAATEDALIGIVPVKRIRIVDFVGFGVKREILMFDCQQFRRVVDRTVTVAVVAYSAVKEMVTENTIKRFSLRVTRCFRIGDDGHSR
jgi:hypothetical protein